MKRLVVPIVTALTLLAISAATAAAEDRDVFCGPAGAEYRCGGILVILKADTAELIADVIERVSGPNTDIFQEFRAVRDLLDPDGIADDTNEAIVYSIAVAVGQEEAMAAAYAADPAVYAAAVDRETIGRVTPDSAMPASTMSWTSLVGALLVLVSGVVVGTRRR